MILRHHTKPVTKAYFKRIIKECLFEKLEPCLVQTSEEITLYYNHPAGLPRRMVARMGIYDSKQEASKAVDELYAIMETVRKEWGL